MSLPLVGGYSFLKTILFESCRSEVRKTTWSSESSEYNPLFIYRLQWLCIFAVSFSSSRKVPRSYSAPYSGQEWPNSGTFRVIGVPFITELDAACYETLIEQLNKWQSQTVIQRRLHLAPIKLSKGKFYSIHGFCLQLKRGARIGYTHNTFLLLQKHLTSGTELILTDWKIVPNESL